MIDKQDKNVEQEWDALISVPVMGIVVAAVALVLVRLKL